MAPDSLDLKNLLSLSKSPYTYNTEHSKERTDRDSERQGKGLSKHDINYYWDQGYFTTSDLQLVKLVAENVFCSTRMLKKSLLLFRRSSENKDISILSDEKNLRDRLRVLVKCELLIKYTLRNNIDFTASNSKTDVEHYYCVSPHGYNYIKRQLYFNRNYDEYLCSTPIEEVFKYLSAVMACQAISCVDGSIDYVIDTPFYSKLLKRKVSLYGIVKADKNDKKFTVIVEPIKFEYEPKKITKVVWDNLIVERFLILKEAICELQKDNPSTNIRVMFVCNDLRSINKSVTLAKSNLFEHLSSSYFVIDAVVDKYSLTSTCIQVDCNNNVAAVTPEFV